MSRIPKFGKTIPNGRSQTTDEVPRSLFIPESTLGLKRRSKSVTDLRVIREERTVNNFQKIKPITKFDKNILKASNIKTRNLVNIKEEKKPADKPVLRAGVKRTGENSKSEIKNKIVKKPVKKVPDWDYKTRFSILNEKHEALLLQFNSAEKNLKDANEIAEQNRQLDKDLKSSQQDLAYAKKELEELHNKVNSSERYVREISEVLEREKNERKKVEMKLKTISEDYKQLELKYQNIQLDNDSVTKELQNTKKELETYYEIVRGLKIDNKELSEKIFNAEKTRRYLHNCIQDLKGNIRVFCRVRPPLTEQEKLFQCSFNFQHEKSIEISKCRSSLAPGALVKTPELQEFNFDRVFDQDVGQNEIFSELSQLVQSALDGYNVCVFAYGQTGSGKTYTMLGGTEAETVGMIPRSIELIFETKKQMEIEGWSYSIQASFMEIYNETIRDLLDMKNEKTMDIRYNDGKGTTVSNLTIKPIESAYEFAYLMRKAEQNRATAVTDYNEHSSRSHAVIKIYIEACYNNSDSKLVGSLILVDLAGSECAKAVIGERLVETKNINKSLSCLGKVMLALYKKDNHIPFRDSKLTYLLQSSLQGSCKCLMVVNISPNEDNYNESVNALRFASKVKEVKTKSYKNKVQKTTNGASKS